jgi:hypothetical protein
MVGDYSVAVKDLVGYELILLRLLAFVDLCLFGHI